jgi:hypothetical protein
VPPQTRESEDMEPTTPATTTPPKK